MDNFQSSFLTHNNQKSYWSSETKTLNATIKLPIDTSSTGQHSPQPLNSIRNAWNTDENYNDSEDRKTNHYRSDSGLFSWCSCWCRGFLLGCLVAGVVLAIIIALWLIKGQTTTDLSHTGSSTIAGSVTTFTSTITTATSSTSVTTTSSATSTTSTSTTTATPTCADWLWDAHAETVAGVTGKPNNTSDTLNAPWNIYVDPTNNNLYIADSQNHRIQLWLPGATNGSTVAGISGISGSSALLLNTPRDVFVDASGNIYVADSSNKRIQLFSPGNTTGSTVSSSWASAGSMWGVQVINQSIYACDHDNNIVWKNGVAVARNQWNNNAGYPLQLPQGFTVDTSVVVGTVYIVNSGGQTIVQWPAGANNGTTVAGIYNSIGNTSTLLAYPTAIKLDNYANMFVVDNNNHRVQLFCRYPVANTTGRTIAGTGSSGQSNNTLFYPAGLALDSSLNLYVADTSNHRVQKFRRTL